MCQQWFSVAGLALDIVGFLFIAFEWHHMFMLENLKKQNEVEKGYAKSHAIAAGEDYTDPDEENYSMWRHMQNAVRYHARYRAWIFYTGAVLVVLGFVGQLVGSLPYGNSVLGLASCS